MDDDVGVIEYSPTALAYSLAAAGRERMALFKHLFEIFTKRFYLRLGRSARNYEIVA